MTEEVICHVQEGDKADVDKAVDAATKVKTHTYIYQILYELIHLIHQTLKKILNINHAFETPQIGFPSRLSLENNGCIRAWNASQQISGFD